MDGVLGVTAPPPPPGLPAPRRFRSAYAGAYALAYLVGGERRMLRLIRRYGPIMTMPILSLGDVAIVSDPALVKEVFTAPPDVLLGGEGVGPAAAIYGSGSMFVQEEPEHLRRRKLLTPPLHGVALAGYVPIIEASTKAAMRDWPVDRPFEMLHAARALMLDVIVKVIFGVEDPAEVQRLGRPFERLLNLGVSEQLTVRYALRRLGTLRVWPSRARANREIDDIVMPLIAARRSDPRLSEQRDILALLMCARGDDGEWLSDSEIRDDLITLMLAGHETTATTLAWAVERLRRHPRLLSRLADEVDAGGSELLQATIFEVQRTRPVINATARMTKTRIRLGEWVVPERHVVMVSIGLAHAAERNFTDPTVFDPDRFVGNPPDSHSWIPYGGGIRRCIGAAFANMEMTVTLRTLLREFEFRSTYAADEPPHSRGVATAPGRGGLAVVYRRGARIAEAVTAEAAQVSA
jgi:cytochrome P450